MTAERSAVEDTRAGLSRTSSSVLSPSRHCHGGNASVSQLKNSTALCSTVRTSSSGSGPDWSTVNQTGNPHFTGDTIDPSESHTCTNTVLLDVRPHYLLPVHPLPGAREHSGPAVRVQ